MFAVRMMTMVMMLVMNLTTMVISTRTYRDNTLTRDELQECLGDNQPYSASVQGRGPWTLGWPLVAFPR